MLNAQSLLPPQLLSLLNGDLTAIPTVDGVEDVEFGDDVSETSTVAWEHLGHEPFDTYKDKVYKMAVKLFPHAGKILVEHMKGGSYNRTVRVTVFPGVPSLRARIVGRIKKRAPKSPLAPPATYILRIPRFQSAPLEQQVAVLNTIAAKLSLPTPKVIKYDASTKNRLGNSYMMQALLEGEQLCHVAKNLNTKQWESVVRNVIDLQKTIAGFQSTSAGEIATANTSIAPDAAVQIEKMYVPRRGLTNHNSSTPSTWPSLPQDTLTELLELCERWREYQRSDGMCFEHIWDGYSIICRSLHQRGFLEGSYSLVHGDLAAHNLLVKIKDESTVVITGVLDWDFAMFAPKFMAYGAPFWLWMDDSALVEDDEDEKMANFEPTGQVQRNNKATFLAEASEEWKKFAFEPEAMLARRMFQVLKSGMQSDWAVKEAEAINNEWGALHPEDKIPFQGFADSPDDDTTSDSDSGGEEEQIESSEAIKEENVYKWEEMPRSDILDES